MIKKEIFIGFIIGLIANAIGLFIAIQLFGEGDSIRSTLSAASAQGFLGKLISLGAIGNLIAFFIFIKKKQDYRARGVMLATILVAILTFVIKF